MGPAEAARDVHRVVAWDKVGENEGTGIVHIAPGCGKEDFALGKIERLVPIAPLDEYGIYLPGLGDLEGKSAVEASTIDQILNNLQEKGVLLATELYPHSYPHCWRCKAELLFRLVDEWFISMSWREEIMKICHDITWIPAFGLQRELDWLKNMGDWMISKKRFWGLALPIWMCQQCNTFDVIGSVEELKEKAISGWKEFEGHSPHRPWIDLVKTRCQKCGGQANRIADVGNPWLDAGIVPYSTMGFSTENEYWKTWFPADFITECFPGQFRNWFYALLSMSTLMTGCTPFKVLLGHALVHDEKGEEMHKSLGNSIPFEEAAEKMSADLMRWMFCRQNPVNNLNFGYGPADALRNKFVLKLWNTYAFFCNYARLDGFDPLATQIPVEERADIDRWILSDLQLLIKTARHEFEHFNIMNFCTSAESFIDERLSNWYIRRNRRRFWKSEQGADKRAAYQTLYTVLTTLAKLFAPIMPFLTECMYQNLVAGKDKTDSVHLCDFPIAEEALIDESLSADMDALLHLVSLGSAARNSVKIKVRQPLAQMVVQPASEHERNAVKRFADQIREELNIKQLSLKELDTGSLLQFEARVNTKTLGPKLGPVLAEVQSALAALSPHMVSVKLLAGKPIELNSSNGPVVLQPGDILGRWKASEGFAGVVDGATQIVIDVRITEQLAQEGVARDAVRHIQELRKKAKFEPEDRIELYVSTDSPTLKRAWQAHLEYICAETLTAKWAAESPGADIHTADVIIDGHSCRIEIKKR